MTTRSTTLILVDSKANSNKFYRLELDANGRVSKTFGRVGAAGVTNYENTGLSGFNTILNAKKRKGYREVDVADDTVAAAPRIASQQLAEVARTGLVTSKTKRNTVIDDLIERIVRVNAHDILESSGGLIKVDTSGRIKTPVGLVTASSIAKATILLDRLEYVTAHDRPSLLEEYLTFVPQKVAARAGWADTFFDPPNSFQRQRDFLQQLRDSLSFFDAQAATQAATPGDAAVDAGFKYKLRAVADGGTVFKKIEALYEASKNAGHQSATMKVKRVYELVDTVGAKAYREIADEIRNEQQLWHGTGAANLLSILRKGLYVPPTTGSGVKIAGRMFGDGIYLSNQSSKAANYSSGFWHGSRENSAFMLLADVAMGSEYRPTRSGFDPAIPREARNTLNKFGKPFNSINVKAGTGGVRNHEAIVWNLPQIRLRHLVELER